jgi:condensin complex subunit 3
MISQPNLPEGLIPKCLDVLSKISNGERDLIRVVVDVITELREGEGDEELEGVCSPIGLADLQVSQASAMGTPGPRKSARVDSDPEATMKAALIDLRCLIICISLLQRVNSVSILDAG